MERKIYNPIQKDSVVFLKTAAETNGFPKNPLVLAYLFEISESNLPDRRSIFEFILRAQASKARKKGLGKELVAKYVKF